MRENSEYLTPKDAYKESLHAKAKAFSHFFLSFTLEFAAREIAAAIIMGTNVFESFSLHRTVFARVYSVHKRNKVALSCWSFFFWARELKMTDITCEL